MRLWLFSFAALWGANVLADPPSNSSLSIDVSFGYESQTSPLFQISPTSTIIYIDGLQRLKGSHWTTNVQGFTDRHLGAGVTVSIAGDITNKRSPDTPDLNFRSISAQPAIHLPVGAGSFGLGINVQNMAIAGMPFRDVIGIQPSWTMTDDKNLWSVMADIGRNRHAGELSDLDGDSYSLMLQRQISEPLRGFDSLDVTAVLGRERNSRGFRDLSDRNAMLHASIQWTLLNGSWKLGRGWRRARFDDTTFAEDPVRTDRTTMLDLAVEWTLSPGYALHIEINEVRNQSTTLLYENRYRQILAGLRASF